MPLLIGKNSMKEHPKYGIMPDSYNQLDEQSIAAKLSMLPPRERIKVANAYSDVYESAFDAEENEIKKGNRARFAANSRLRIYIEKKFAIFNK